MLAYIDEPKYALKTMSESLPSVTEVVAERIQSGSQPGLRDDPYRVSLILQGGAMRGAVSAGAAVGFEALMGEAEPFDQTDDTSAGGFCWGTLASRNAVEGASVYYEDLSEDFISLRRGFKGGRVVDLSILIRAVTEGEKAFDYDRLLHSPVDTHIYATSVHDAKKVKFTVGNNALHNKTSEDANGHVVPCKTKEDITAALEATAHLTYYAGPPVAFRGMLLIDGGVTAGRVPLHEAIADDCTHVLVVSTDKITDPALYKRKLEERVAVALAIRRQHPYLADRYWAGFDRHVDTLRMLQAAEAGEIASPQIEVIKANSIHLPHSMETNPQKLYVAAKAGEEAVLRTFRPYGLKRGPDSTVRLPRTSR